MIHRLENLDGLAWIERLKSPHFRWDLTQLKDLSASHDYWAVMEGDKPVAFTALIRLPPAWEIPVLATHPDHQGRGYMRKLLQQLFDTICQGAEIWLEVHEANAPARALYQTLGFVEVGRRPRYYADGGTAVLLSRGP